jgi:hypothetical protein
MSADIENYPGELAMLRGLLGVLRVTAKHGDFQQVQQLLAEHERDEQDAYNALGEKATAPAATATPFFQPGHTYADSKPQYDWKFRCDTVTTHPADGTRAALGWRHFRGEWEPYAYGEDDWEIHQLVDHIDVTEGGDAR